MISFSFARLTALSVIATAPMLADLITSSSQIGPSQTVDFSQFGGAVPTIVRTTPISVGAGVTLTSTNPDGSFLGSGPYSFNDNGSWNSSLTLAGLDVDLFGGDQYTMTFAFAQPVKAVGGILDYAVFPASGFSDVVITAFGSDGSMLEMYDITKVAPISSQGGQFLGIGRGQADIASFSLSNSAVAIRNLTFSSAVPEPAAASLLPIGGLLLFFHLGRSRPSAICSDASARRRSLGLHRRRS
jgi:hypothetical protein